VSTRRNIWIFASALILFAFGAAVRNAVFNNYLVDIFDFTAEQRGWLELPRELPGLLVTLSIGLFFFMRESKLLGASCLVAAAGMFGLGLFTTSVPHMIVWLFIWSMGTHIQLVLIERVALDVGLAKGAGHSLGRMNGLRSLGMIAGSLMVMVYPALFKFRYDSMFLIAGAAMLLGALGHLSLSGGSRMRDGRGRLFTLRKRYSRYYVLAALFGTRKQIFITFAPWFLVKVLGLRPGHIAQILMISAAIGIFAKPLLGRMVDRFGERRILQAEALVSAGFSLAYTISPIFLGGLTLVVVCAICYILDDLLYTLRTARTTWLVKIAEKPEDITEAMSASVSIDHLLSISVSLVAGYAWIYMGFETVFLFCTLVAVAMSIVSTGIRIPGTRRT
jgi:hypothetical protein